MSSSKKIPYSINLSSQSYLINQSLRKPPNSSKTQKSQKPLKQKSNPDLSIKNSAKNKITNSVSKLNTSPHQSKPTTARKSQNNESSQISILKDCLSKKTGNNSQIFNKSVKNFNSKSQKIIQELGCIFDSNKISTPLNNQTNFKYYNQKKNKSVINFDEKKIISIRNNSKSINFSKIDDNLNKTSSFSNLYIQRNNKNQTKSLIDFLFEKDNNDYIDLPLNSNKLVNKLNTYTKRIKYVQKLKSKEININKEIIKSMKNGIFNYKNQYFSPTYKNIEINQNNFPSNNNILSKNIHFNSSCKKLCTDVGNEYHKKSIKDLMYAMHDSRKTDKFIIEMRVNSNSAKRNKFSYNGNCDNEEVDKFYENKKIREKSELLAYKKNQKLNCLLSKIPKHPIYKKQGCREVNKLYVNEGKNYFLTKNDDRYVVKYEDTVMPVNNTLFS